MHQLVVVYKPPRLGLLTSPILLLSKDLPSFSIPLQQFRNLEILWTERFGSLAQSFGRLSLTRTDLVPFFGWVSILTLFDRLGLAFSQR
jgi:hypothetical protein